MKLHLGCGERYLEGYVNIDYPPSKHTVQTKSVADEHADIAELHHAPESIDEVRLHHVFEHFTRSRACAFLCAWHIWLKKGGIVHIEVPDFHRTALAVLSPFSPLSSRMVALRHIFGSQETDWAAHLEGYTPDNLKKMLEGFGYRVEHLEKNSWKGTFNFVITARKAESLDSRELNSRARYYLSLFCLDQGDDEMKMLEIWMNDFNTQFERSTKGSP